MNTTYPDFNKEVEEHKHVPTRKDWKTERVETLKDTFHKGDEIVINELPFKITAVGNRGMTIVYNSERFPDD